MMSSKRVLRVGVGIGALPEAADLKPHSDGLRAVRERVRRETLGAVPPLRQALAVEAILLEHREHLSTVIAAATQRNSGAICIADGANFVFSLLEDMNMAYYWLLLVWTTRKLPAKGRPNFSVLKSNEKRHEILRRIHSSRRLAGGLMGDMEALLPSNVIVRAAFSSIRLQMLCIEISATRHALFSASDKTPLPKDNVGAMLARLDAIRLRPDFATRSSGDRDLFWATAAVLYDELGDDRGRAIAMKERRALTEGDPDAQLQLLVQMTDDATTDEEKLTLLSELTELARSSDPGPIFSQERIGRVSMLGDGLWSTATSISYERPLAAASIDEALVCYRAWTFGDGGVLGDKTIRVISDWTAGGHGRVRWEADGSVQTREFRLDHELVERFFFDREAMGPADRGAALGLARFLDHDLGPILVEAIEPGEEVRIQAGGSAAVLPLLAATVGDAPLGASSAVAYAHPDPAVGERPPLLRPFELLVVDDCFGEASAKVRSALQFASPTCRILRFNSEKHGTELAHDVLEEALGSVSSALIFCHVDTPVLYGAESAILTGPGGRLRMEAVAGLELSDLEELALVGCASGRPNLFLGDVTVAHAAAMAGVRQILYSLSPIRPRLGSEFASRLAEEVGGRGMAEFLAGRYRSDPQQAASFSIMRP